MINTATKLILILAVLGSVVAIVMSQYPALMDRAESLLAGQTEDPPDDTVTTYEETRQAYQTFDNMRETMRDMAQSQDICVGQHEPLSERVGHPFVSAESDDSTNTVFMMLERNGSGSILRLYQMGLDINEDNEYTIRNVQVIEEERIALKPCVMGRPQHSGESPLEANLQAKMQGQVTIGGPLDFTAEELEEATVNKIFWHGPHQLIAYSNKTYESARRLASSEIPEIETDVETTATGLPAPSVTGYRYFASSSIDGSKYSIPQTILETSEVEVLGGKDISRIEEKYIPGILEDANHVMMKVTPTNKLYPQYVCFIPSGEDQGDGVLGSQEYKTLLESTVEDESVEVCSP